MALLGLRTIRTLSFGALFTVVLAAENTALQVPVNEDFKLRAKRNCQMGECGPEEYYMICRKCPICCMEPATTMGPPPLPPPPQPAPCCQPVPVPVPVPVPMPVPRPPPTPLPEIPPTQQCCYAPRPSRECCQAPPSVPPQIILCCQMRPEPANPCCQAAAAAAAASNGNNAPQQPCVCNAPRPIPCRCSAPTPSSPPMEEMECAMATCPVFISRCPKALAAQQPEVCRRRRYRRDAFQSLLQQLSHNIPFSV